MNFWVLAVCCMEWQGAEGKCYGGCTHADGHHCQQACHLLWEGNLGLRQHWCENNAACHVVQLFPNESHRWKPSQPLPSWKGILVLYREPRQRWNRLNFVLQRTCTWNAPQWRNLAHLVSVYEKRTWLQWVRLVLIRDLPVSGNILE